MDLWEKKHKAKCYGGRAGPKNRSVTLQGRHLLALRDTRSEPWNQCTCDHVLWPRVHVTGVMRDMRKTCDGSFRHFFRVTLFLTCRVSCVCVLKNGRGLHSNRVERGITPLVGRIDVNIMRLYTDPLQAPKLSGRSASCSPQTSRKRELKYSLTPL